MYGPTVPSAALAADDEPFLDKEDEPGKEEAPDLEPGLALDLAAVDAEGVPVDDLGLPFAPGEGARAGAFAAAFARIEPVWFGFAVALSRSSIYEV